MAYGPLSIEGFRSGSRSVALAMLAVVASFVGSTIYTQLRMRAGAGAIESTAASAPRIALLSDARTELRRYQLAIEQALAGPPFNAKDGAAEIRAGRQALQARLDVYARAPRSADEEALFSRVQPQLAHLDELTARELADGHGAQTDGRVLVTIQQTIDIIDDLLRLLVDRAALGLARDAQIIRRSQARSDLIAFSLDAFSIALAVLAGAIAIGKLRRYFLLLERRAHELEHFALQVGHDIFNPLTPIAVALRLSSERLHDPESRRMLARGDRAVERIQRNIESLLAFARAGTPPAQTDRTAIAPILEAAIASLHGDNAITVEVVPYTDREVACTPAVLTRLLFIFLQNGARRSAGLPDPRLTVRVQELPTRVRIEVADAGPPLTQAGIAEAFDPDLHGPAGSPGIALERAMARRMVEVHRGAVGVLAAFAGAIYWFELPRAE